MNMSPATSAHRAQEIRDIAGIWAYAITVTVIKLTTLTEFQRPAHPRHIATPMRTACAASELFSHLFSTHIFLRYLAMKSFIWQFYSYRWFR